VLEIAFGHKKGETMLKNQQPTLKKISQKLRLNRRIEKLLPLQNIEGGFQF
jgi:hypothetical protein